MNSKAGAPGNYTCPGILGTKSYIVTPDDLEKHGIDFYVVSCRKLKLQIIAVVQYIILVYVFKSIRTIIIKIHIFQFTVIIYMFHLFTCICYARSEPPIGHKINHFL